MDETGKNWMFCLDLVKLWMHITPPRSPPENFDFSDFPSWPNWIRRFERFRVAAGLDQKGEAYQVNSLVYAMGDKDDDILCTLGLSDEDKKKYKPVKEAFDKYFICKHNVIYERCRFNKRSQEPGESAESFISAVYKLAEHCNYGAMQKEIIRDRLVVGIRYQGLSDRPWQRVGADLFQWNSAMYLLVVDYFSRYIEVANLTSTTSAFVMEKLKAIFSRHGVAEVLVTDGGPQFASAEFADFAREYDFQHVTSSPRYPQGNSEAERAVGTVKSLLRKGEDPHKALMAYRATPLAQGASPAQLLMG
ncbi:hypothetical protein D4764_21G0008570 [Takifugu flavidus]|uniref:Integrase catalytic domain-containing protein n=1 Tax=Takifugu flavidus TaxID=433684 RepID=A0A5C6NJZ0_9TELE|nr:hypothetical protein D4764_21G0008570 [Takifugu flavidus]